MKEKRRDKMKEKMKRHDEREKKREDEMENERENEEIEVKEEFFKCSRPPNPPDELAQHVSKKSLSDELFLHFSAKVQNLAVFHLFT